jgi:SAM-dependent methyltransferase
MSAVIERSYRTSPQFDATAELRCPECRGSLEYGRGNQVLLCAACKVEYPITGGIPRMLPGSTREKLDNQDAGKDIRLQTALSFAYEWSHFSEMRPEWEQNFLAYFSPRKGPYFQGKRILDAGCGTGRHAYYAASFGGIVRAMDLGRAADVAARNTMGVGNVQVIQADLYHPPFELESFDLVYSIGVLHHLPDPEGAFRNLARFVKPGGEMLVYLYWKAEGRSLKSLLLAAISQVRRITTRLPHGILHVLSYPVAWLAHALFVLPYVILRRIPGMRNLAERIPMKQYAQYPFKVCVNDQFDRLSAPIENRYTRQQVMEWFKNAQFENIYIHENFGWCGSGRKPKNG